jgi:hypothetical protein
MSLIIFFSYYIVEVFVKLLRIFNIFFFYFMVYGLLGEGLKETDPNCSLRSTITSLKRE